MSNHNNQNYNSAPPYYDEEINLIDQYTTPSSSSNSNIPLPSSPPRRASVTQQFTGNSNNVRPNHHNPFLTPTNNTTTANNSTISIRPSPSIFQTPTINHSHSAPYLNSNFTGSGNNSSSQYSDGNPFQNNHSSPHLDLSNNVRDQRVVSENLVRSTATGSMRAVSSNYSNTKDRNDQRRDYLPSLPNQTGTFEYDVGMGGMSFSSTVEVPHSNSAFTTPFKPSIYTSTSNHNQPTSPRQIHSTNPNSPLPALPTNTPSVLSNFASSLNSAIDTSFSQIDKFVQSELSRRNQSSDSSTNLSTSSTKPSTSPNSDSDASDPLTNAFLSSFPSLDEQSPVLPPKSLSPHSTGSETTGGDGFSTETTRDELKKQIGTIVRDEIRRRDELVRIDLEREIKELKVNFLFDYLLDFAS